MATMMSLDVSPLDKKLGSHNIDTQTNQDGADAIRKVKVTEINMKVTWGKNKGQALDQDG